MRINKIFWGVLLTVLLSVCPPKVSYHQNSTPEESGLSLMKITDESVSVVGGSTSSTLYGSVSDITAAGICTNAGFTWSATRLLDISPDGSELAYLSSSRAASNDSYNIWKMRFDL